MLFADTLSTAHGAIRAHRMRSALTMLGIIIGVGSVVLMVSVGRSFERYILDQVESFSGHLIEIYPTGFEKFGKSLEALTMSDLNAIEHLTTVTSIAPVIFIGEKVSYETEVGSPLIFGTTPEFFANYGLKLDRGRLLTGQDVQGATAVAVVAYQTSQDLFGQRDPIGERIKIGSRFYTVVGVMEGVGSALLQNLDTPVYVPFTTAKGQTGIKNPTYMTMRSTVENELAMADVTALLRQRHSIVNPDNDPDKDDFRVRSAAQTAEIIGTVGTGLTAFIGLIAGISLIVGGIGIMNIMLVSVTERTKEIGLRKALGARKKDILLQFLVEAVSLTLLGGCIGMVGGLGLGMLLAAVASKFVGHVPFVLSWSAIIAALAMALGTGLAFGIYPAKQAANLSPMEAIRSDR